MIDLFRDRSKHDDSVRALGAARFVKVIFACSVALMLGCHCLTLYSQEPGPDLPVPDLSEPGLVEISAQPIQVSGNTVWRWQVDGADASMLQGDCYLQHEGRSISAERILILVDGPVGNVRHRIAAEGIDGSKGAPVIWTTTTMADPLVQAPHFLGSPDSPPALLQTLIASTASKPLMQSSDQIKQVQFAQPLQNGIPDSSLQPPADSAAESPRFYVGGGTQSVEIRGRSASSAITSRTIDRPETGETIIAAQGGVTVLVRDVSATLTDGQMIELGTISLSADRIIFWSPRFVDVFNGSQDLASGDGELYLEGDIVFRQGERIIYAQSMYYNVAQKRGMVLDAEAITTVPDYQGIVRLKAKVLQQVGAGNFQAFDAAITTSRMGVPRYWLQSQRLQLTDRQSLTTDPTTGAQRLDRDPFVESSNNFVYVSGVPIFYWPTLATSLQEPSYFVSGVGIGNDNIFGTQVKLDFNLFQLFGIADAPPGVQWELSTDYFSDRGPALGTSLRYDLPGLFGVPGNARGNFDAWGIYDTGSDNLGSDRRDLEPESTLRGRGLLRHRQFLPNDYELIAEIGYLSDRNFLEQYLENEWDQDVDHQTGLRLRKYSGSNLIDLSAQVQTNDFYTQTERLPHLDHYLLGGSLFGDRFTYSAHNQVGYARLNAADLPTDAAEAAEFSAVPGDIDSSGIVASTKHEIALPFQLGALKLVPNIGGEATHYGEAVDGDSLTRLVGQAGIRANLPMWRVDPTIQSSLLNVRGLAHKVDWTAEYFFADSDTGRDEVPFYDPLDDNAQEQFRRRFIGDVFGGVLPDQFDPRTYAFRNGIQRGVTSPSDVVVDDLQQFRLGVHQRFQTKRGLPGRERITDLFQFDVDTVLFPEADRDNFGEHVGPTTYDMRYHVGDRVTLLSDGYIDFFDDGLRSISAGIRSSRPGVGDVYVGLLSIEGPVSSTVLRSTVDYRLNEKWIASAGNTYDFGEIGNVGQTLALTRIGESFLVRLGVNVDSGRDNVGFGFSIEPRFFPRPKLGRVGGQLIPPPGVEGLE